MAVPAINALLAIMGINRAAQCGRESFSVQSNALSAIIATDATRLPQLQDRFDKSDAATNLRPERPSRIILPYGGNFQKFSEILIVASTKFLIRRAIVN